MDMIQQKEAERTVEAERTALQWLRVEMIQFVEQLMELKEEKLKETRLDPDNSPDLVLKVELMGTQPRIWRRVQVPAAIPLFTLADKVLTPVMGWVRNFHAYSFVDVRDGAHFGPVRMDSVDMVHVTTHFYAMMDDEKVQLGQLARKKGEQLVWIYDIGDYWEHRITVEKVAAPSGVRLLDGEMSCPAENEHGNRRWQEEVLDLLPPLENWDGACYSASQKLKQKLHELIHTMVNLRESGQVVNKGDGISRCCLFDPFDFDLQHQRNMLRMALASNLRSQEGGSKVFMMRLGKNFDKVDGDAALRPKRRGCAPQRNEKGMYEDVNLRRDKRDLALCGQCGKTSGLRICRGCRTLYYCSEECQTVHWAAGHKKECKVLGKIHQDVKEEGRGASAEASGGHMEPKQGPKVVDDLVAKLDSRGVFFEDNIYLYDEEGGKKGDFIINKFKFYTAFFSDEEVANLEESRSFEDMETYFNLLVTKYSKVVGEVPENWKGWEDADEDGNKSSKEDEKEESGSNKGRKNKKNENKRKMRRKLL